MDQKDAIVLLYDPMDANGSAVVRPIFTPTNSDFISIEVRMRQGVFVFTMHSC